MVHRSNDEALRIAARKLQKPFVDATLLHVDVWTQRLHSHMPFELVLAWHPAPWRLRLPPFQLGFIYQPKKAHQALFSHSLSAWKAARDYLQASPPELRRARDTVTQLLLMCLLGCQLLEHGRIIDFGAGADVQKELEGYDSEEWLWWQTMFEPRLDDFQVRLARLARGANGAFPTASALES